jgi:MoaA/NifB/PqqE/SkfB family radical SAM enzyme
MQHLTPEGPSAGVAGNGTPLVENFRLGTKNMTKMRGRAPRAFGAIRFDPNNNCNVHCVYCHSPRSEALVDPEDFRAFLWTSVISVEEFQIGCGMEPTLDPRLCDFMEIVAGSPGRPRQRFQLQTNGILLHRHDAGRMRTAGLSHLSVSVDSPRASTHKDLRGGTSLAKVERNLRNFHRTCPAIHMIFLTTVTSANIDDLRDLMVWGLDVGARHFVFRQMVHVPDSSLVDHARMSSLLVSADQFADLKGRITGEFARDARIHFVDNSTLRENWSRAAAVSEIEV